MRELAALLVITAVSVGGMQWLAVSQRDHSRVASSFVAGGGYWEARAFAYRAKAFCNDRPGTRS